MGACGVDLWTTRPPTELASGMGLAVNHANGLILCWGAKFAFPGVAAVASQTGSISPAVPSPAVRSTSIMSASGSTIAIIGSARQACFPIAGNARLITRLVAFIENMISPAVVALDAISSTIVVG